MAIVTWQKGHTAGDRKLSISAANGLLPLKFNQSELNMKSGGHTYLGYPLLEVLCRNRYSVIALQWYSVKVALHHEEAIHGQLFCPLPFPKYRAYLVVSVAHFGSEEVATKSNSRTQVQLIYVYDG